MQFFASFEPFEVFEEQYLIYNNIIIVSAIPTYTSDSQDIPQWVKNNACWWSQGLISDVDFAAGIEFLVKLSLGRRTEKNE